MIRKILIEGVRTHERTEVELGRLTCLVGPNGSGKSTVLLAFQSQRGQGPEPWLRVGARSSEVSMEGTDGKKISRNRRLLKMLNDEQEVLVKARSFRFKSEILRSSSEHTSGQPALGSDGSHLATILAGWKLSDESRFETVVKQLKQIVKMLENLRPSLADDKRFELLFDFRNAPGIPAYAVSEGTLFALGLLTALHEFNSPPDAELNVVLLDDVDRGLHPDAQVELVQLLRKLAEMKDLQIVMTSHSPFVVDALQPEEVYVLALDDTGTTRARKLSEIPGAERYRGMLSTGQLWSSQGESWVLEDQSKSKAT